MRPFTEYILHGVNRPANLAIKLGVEITPCHKITESDRSHLPDEAKNWGYLPPQMIRIGGFSGIPSKFIFPRYIFLNNFCFFLIVLKRAIATNELRTAQRQLQSVHPDVTFLDPHVKGVTIKVSSTTAFETAKDGGMALMEKWQEYVREQANKVSGVNRYPPDE